MSHYPVRAEHASFVRMKLSIGPGALVAAAFIGPGTVTVCTLAGAQFGFTLVWALVFATISTIILQDMCSRLGASAGLGLGEALMKTMPSQLLRVIVGGLVFTALAIGNAAYEAGNLAGGALGLESVFGDQSRRVFVLFIAAVAAIALFIGKYRVLERLLVGLVLIMSAAFATTAILARPDLGAMLSGLRPSVPEGGWLTAIALIGTTVVPYNLFLHAAAVRAKWGSAGAVGDARWESGVSIFLGGLVSVLILAAAAGAVYGQEVSGGADLAKSLEPVWGSGARYLVGIGLLGAGLTSAITAPMATAFALTELAGGPADKRQGQFRWVALTIVAIGAAVALSGWKPVSLILVAQAANGLLLPIVATFLLIVMNRKSLLGDHANGLWTNLLGFVVVAMTFGLGARALWLASTSAFGSAV